VERSSGAAPPRPSGRGERGEKDELLTIAVDRGDDGFSVVALAGELDLSTIPKLEGPLFDELDSCHGVMVDLTTLSFIDSSGIALLIRAHQVANGSRKLQALVSQGSQVERIFAIAGIAQAFPIFVDREEAIAALRG
jgi:anti-sigma B factor antagonist